MKVTIARKEHFNAAHRIYNPEWSDEKNEDYYGKCNNYNYHGHNYEMIVKVRGKVDPETGYVMNINQLKKIIREEVTNKLDHKNLNLDIPDFQNIIPSSENLVIYIWNKLRQKIDRSLELKVILFETPRNFVEYDGN